MASCKVSLSDEETDTELLASSANVETANGKMAELREVILSRLNQILDHTRNGSSGDSISNTRDAASVLRKAAAAATTEVVGDASIHCGAGDGDASKGGNASACAFASKCSCATNPTRAMRPLQFQRAAELQSNGF